MSKINHSRTLTYAFLQLPYHVKIRIVRDLDLVSGKTPLHETDFFAKCFRKAKTDKKLEQLWDETFKETKDAGAKMGNVNPYKPDPGPAVEDRTFESFEENFKSTTAAMMRRAQETGEAQMAHFSTDGWRYLADGKGRIRIENIEVTVTPIKKKLN